MIRHRVRKTLGSSVRPLPLTPIMWWKATHSIEEIVSPHRWRLCTLWWTWSHTSAAMFGWRWLRHKSTHQRRTRHEDQDQQRRGGPLASLPVTFLRHSQWYPRWEVMTKQQQSFSEKNKANGPLGYNTGLNWGQNCWPRFLTLAAPLGLKCVDLVFYATIKPNLHHPFPMGL